jgi:hypothetical protein
VGKGKKPHPACPGAGMPPGHNKVDGPSDRPCGHKGGHGHGRNGIVFLFPFWSAGLAAPARRRLAGVRRLRVSTRRSTR